MQTLHLSYSPILLALASMIFQSLGDGVYKRSQNHKAYPELFLVYQSYSFGITSLALVYIFDVFRTDWVAWKYGPICGVVGFTAYFCFLSSLREGQVSINTMIFRLSFVLTAVLAIVFLGEPITLQKSIGLITAALAVLSLTVFPILFSNGSANKTHVSTPGSRKSIILAITAMLLLGVLSFVYKLAASEGVPGPSLIFIQFAFFSPIAMLYAYFRKRFVWHQTSVNHGLSAGVLLSLALILLVSALGRGDAGVVVPINQMSFVLIAVLAVPWFKESWTIWKTIAVGFAALTIWLLSS
ncbi:EamA family transporter [Pseudomonadota bacterium]